MTYYHFIIENVFKRHVSAAKMIRIPEDVRMVVSKTGTLPLPYKNILNV